MPTPNQYRIVMKRHPHEDNWCSLCGQKCVEYMDLDIGLFLEGMGDPVCPDCAVEPEPHLAKLMQLAITLAMVERQIAEVDADKLARDGCQLTVVQKVEVHEDIPF